MAEEKKNEPKIKFDGKEFTVPKDHSAVKELHTKLADAQKEIDKEVKNAYKALDKTEAELVKATQKGTADEKKAAAAKLKEFKDSYAKLSKLEGTAEHEALVELASKHATDAHKTLEPAAKKFKTAQTDLTAAEDKLIAGLDKSKLKENVAGITDKNLKAAEEALEGSIKKVKGAGMLGVLRTEGFGAALKQNLGGEAWKKAPVKTGFKAAVIAAGAYLALDALARSEKKNEENQPEQRSWVSRIGELGIGSAAVIGAGLGGRVR